MEANNNSEHKNESQYSIESSTSRSGQPSSSTHLQDKPRDRKHKKRSCSHENDWNAASINRDTSDRLKKQKNINGNDQINGNQSYDVSGPSRQMATPLHQKAATIPPNQQVMHQQPLYPSSYPPHFGYGSGDNFADHNVVNCRIMPINMNSMMPMPRQWPVNNGLPIPASNVGINSNICATPVSNGVEMMPSTSSAVGPYPFMGMANSYGMVQPSMNFCPSLVMPSPIISNFTLNAPIVLSNAVLTPPLPGENITRAVQNLMDVELFMSDVCLKNYSRHH
ncbi:hypothetical protein TNCV_1531321 [Trichonephila clavipes]|nr:hypothetical protein TNCV_1531321 [Trichonephila clavipes]